jgi:mono/diheme cytochrome c family protein
VDTKTSLVSTVALAIVASVAGTGVRALDEEAQIKLGQAEYMENCAVCHGASGKGDGPAAEALSVQPADLTLITTRYSGQFPAEQIYRIIDGRETINPHGDRDMPIWGYRYWDQAQARAKDVHLDVDSQAMVHGRISALVKYLESIQDK